MKFKNKFLQSLYEHRYTFIYTALSLSIVWFHLYQASDLPPNFTFEELEVAQGAQKLDIIANPVNAPYKLLLFLSLKLAGISTIGMRLPSLVLSLVGLIALYVLSNHWLGRRLAVLTTAFAGLSAWTLHIARFTTGNSMLLLLTPLLMWLTIYTLENRSTKAMLSYGLVLGLGLYTPYFIWVAVASLVTFGILKSRWMVQFSLKITLGTILLFILASSGFLTQAIREPTLLMSILGLPVSTFQTPLATILQNGAVEFLSFLFISPTLDPAFSLIGHPRLSIMTTIFFLLGIYSSLKYRDKAYHLYLAILLVAIAIPTILTQGQIFDAYTSLIPAVFMVAALGINELVSHWYSVFPFNPVARSLVIWPLLLLLGLFAFYNYQRYFRAWAHAPETQNVFTIGEDELRRHIDE